jgi:hypothetical protein
VHLVGDPRVHLAVFVQNAFRADQARRVEHDGRPSRIDLDHRTGLNVDRVLAGLRGQAIRVLVRNRYGQLREQLFDGGEHRRCVRELGKDDEPNGKEGRAARDRRIDHRGHPIRIAPHLCTIDRIGQIGLARCRRVADHALGFRHFPESTIMLTTA